jgi:hypothetical protein
VKLLTPDGAAAAGRVAVSASLRDALSQIVAAGGRPLEVLDGDGAVAGIVTLELLGGLLA